MEGTGEQRIEGLRVTGSVLHGAKNWDRRKVPNLATNSSGNYGHSGEEFWIAIRAERQPDTKSLFVTVQPE